MKKPPLTLEEIENIRQRVIHHVLSIQGLWKLDQIWDWPLHILLANSHPYDRRDFENELQWNRY